MAQRAATQGVDQPRGAAGWVAGAEGVELSALLAAADRALAIAQAQGHGAVCIRSGPDAAGGMGAHALMDWVDQAIDTGRFVLTLQNVVSVPEGTPVQREAYLRLLAPDGRKIAARDFLPLLQRERKAAFVDRAVLMQLRSAVDAGCVAPGMLAVNLSSDTFAAGELPAWLHAGLDGWPAAVPLVFELRETDAVAFPDAAVRFAIALRERGAAVALDHFGTHAGGIAALRRLLPSYVKLDASLSRGLEAAERRFQVEALVRAAHMLEIPVWAQVFDSPGALELLAEMGIAGAQGFTLAPEQALQ